MEENYFAITAPGLEPLTARELQASGITPTAVETGGVGFSGPPSAMYGANLRSRTATRILLRVASFHSDSFFELERRTKRIPWERFVAGGRGVEFSVTCRKSRLYHSGAVAERLTESVLRRIRGSDVNGEAAQLFVVRIDHDHCTISADTSGELLHRRGYRSRAGKAPLRETLAAAMLLGAEWDRRAPLLDPFCGSGTIPIEAALLARNIAPGIRRNFAFEAWPETSREAVAEMRSILSSAETPRVPVRITGSDRDAGSVAAGRENAAAAGVTDDVSFDVRAISAATFPEPPGWVITNPPYGIRVNERRPIENLYAQFGKVLRARARGSRVAILSPDRRLETRTGVAWTEVFRTKNGGLPVRFVTGEVR